MTRRPLASLAGALALAATTAPAFADYSIGFDPDYVLNPYGKEVPQTHQQASLGDDPWYVPGTYERPALAQRKVEPRERQDQYAHAPHVEPGHAYGERWLGEQADA
jgi:hypothetical protein